MGVGGGGAAPIPPLPDSSSKRLEFLTVGEVEPGIYLVKSDLLIHESLIKNLIIKIHIYTSLL